MLTRSVCRPAALQWQRQIAKRFRLRTLFQLTIVLLSSALIAHSEETDSADDQAMSVAASTSAKPPVESEVIIEGLASYGNYRIFAAGRDCKLYTAGFEYDRHSWGYLLRARVDYVAEFLPLVLLNQPTLSYPWGQPLTTARRVVPGIGISPIGFRLMWRSNTRFKPYLLAKGGMLGFTKKVPAPEASYENFSLQSGMGVQTRLTPRVDLRLGLFSDFHFSNNFIVPDNPGLDVMNANLGISYHLGKKISELVMAEATRSRVRLRRCRCGAFQWW